MKYLCLFLIMLSVSCRESESSPAPKITKKEKTAESIIIQPISDEESAKTAEAYERSLEGKPLHPSLIDKLTSAKDIESFIRKLDTNYRKFDLKPIPEFDRRRGSDSIMKIVARNLGINKSFYKYDLDGNGFTDILAFGNKNTCIGISIDDNETYSCDYTCIAIMATKYGYTIQHINKRHYNDDIVPKIIADHKTPLLKIYDYHRKIWQNEIIKDTSIVALTYRNNTFIEYNPKPKDNQIKKIEYITSRCYGTCPVFQLTINKGRPSYFIAKYFNFTNDMDNYTPDEEGFFKTAISAEKYNEIVDLLNYLDFKNLKESYTIMATDNPGCFLRITYGDGKVKQIGDYGMQGTFGLMKLYELLSDLRFNQEWKKTQEVKGIRIEER
ncbi:MAG TPA: DUF6438 domain-containing protein [Flavobacterium sp.]|nr:DUF6438 domain-containing protein [Flavobacterium sp.]